MLTDMLDRQRWRRALAPKDPLRCFSPSTRCACVNFYAGPFLQSMSTVRDFPTKNPWSTKAVPCLGKSRPANSGPCLGPFPPVSRFSLCVSHAVAPARWSYRDGPRSYIYIYIYRERERERFICMYMYVHMYIYIYTYKSIDMCMHLSLSLYTYIYIYIYVYVPEVPGALAAHHECRPRRLLLLAGTIMIITMIIMIIIMIIMIVIMIYIYIYMTTNNDTNTI